MPDGNHRNPPREAAPSAIGAPSTARNADLCLGCRYPLVGIDDEGLCPECGYPARASRRLTSQTAAAELGRLLTIESSFR